MSSLTQWDRLVRYVSAKDGKVRYGEPIVSDSKPDIDELAQKGGLKVKVLEGATPLQAVPTGEEDEVKELLGPLTPKDVPIIRCTGLNYKTHSKPTSTSDDLVHKLTFRQSSRRASTYRQTQRSSSSQTKL